MTRERGQRGRIIGRIAPRVLAVCALVACGGCSSFFSLSQREPVAPPKQEEAGRATVRTRGAPPTAPATAPVNDPMVAEPPDPEPAPAPSDSSGIARLVRLAHLWHTVSLHHPAVATRGVPWDSALIIATLRVRAAQDDGALAHAYRRMLALLRDPATRIEAAGDVQPAPVAITSERTDDSIAVLRIATTSPLDAADSVVVSTLLERLPSRLLLDLRGAAVRDPATWAARLDAFLARTGFTARLVAGTVAAPVERSRRIGTWTSVGRDNDTREFHDGWQQPSARTYTGQASASPRFVVLADSGTVLPGVLLALHDAGSASLLADGGLRDAAPVQQTRVPLSNGLVAIVRTGELVHGDGTLGVHADSVVARDAGMSADVALQTAMTMLRSPARLPLAARPLPVLVPPARTPIFYDTTAYPFMGARLLGGFRLWSAMRARHAHRDLYDDDLDAVFDRVIPRLEAARSAEEYAKGIAELAASLDDTEGALLGTSASAVIGEAAMPFRVRSAEGRVHVTDVVRDSTTTALAIVPGTEITAFDGFPMVAWLSEHRRVQPASNDWSRTRALMQQLSRGRIGDVVMKVRDANNRERTLTVPRTVAYREALPVVERTGAAVRPLVDGIAYVDVERLSDATLDAELPTALGARGLVLDLRGRLTIDDVRLLRRLATRPRSTVGRVIQRTLTAPCFAAIREATVTCADVRESRGWERAIDTSAVYGGRLVALIDERTQGAMERLAMTLEQMADVTFIGSASAGSVSWTTPLSLPGGLRVGIASQELRRADGGQVQRVGLTPLIEVRPTSKGLRAGDDEVLARARQWLQQQLDPPSRRRRE